MKRDRDESRHKALDEVVSRLQTLGFPIQSSKGTYAHRNHASSHRRPDHRLGILA